ncbi:MAG: 4Fe-4S binding protein [Calditrichia bacterium]
MGTTIDISSKLLKSPGNKNLGNRIKLKWLKHAFLFFLITAALLSHHWWGYLDPLAILTRISTVLIYPLGAMFTEKTLMSLLKFSPTSPLIDPVYTLFKTNIVPEKAPLTVGVFGVMLLAGFIWGTEKISRRFWCRHICPAGALLGLLSQFRFYERYVSESCTVCNRCQVECKMNAIPEGDVKETDKTECIECFNCGSECPPKVSAISYKWNWKPYRSEVDLSRRKFITATVGGVAAVGLLQINLPLKKEKAAIIRPPGAIPESDFLDKCIRCLECVRICQSNGACLQPAGISDSLENIWTPVANMREGYCEYGCNLCGQVCPTDAILPLPLQVKKKLPMGVAYFDKNLCIPYARHEDCLVCEEHCPIPDKAIKFHIQNTELPDGSIRKVKYPYVERELCIGCGICENKCPLPTQPGVFVISEKEQRWENTPTLEQIQEKLSPSASGGDYYGD